MRNNQHLRQAGLVLCGALLAVGPAQPISARKVTRSFCEVVGGAKLSRESGGAAGICEAISKAAGTNATGKAHVIVHVVSNARLSAQLVSRRGTALPDQYFAVSDANLTRASIGRFARVVADALAADDH